MANPRETILDLYGSFIRDFGGWIAVADLIRLLDTLGIDEASSRSAVSRMKRAELLHPAILGGVKGYRLTTPAEEWFADGDQRILHRSGPVEHTRWVLVSFSVPEGERMMRYRLRARLSALGFGQASAGLMVAPVAVMAETERTLRREGLDSYVTLWDATHAGFTSTAAMVASAWDLPAIRAAYDTYMASQRPVPAALESVVDDDREAFRHYVANVNAWRALPYLDPGLPLSALPAGWPSSEAAQLFDAVAARLRPGAWRWFVRICSRNHEVRAKAG